MRDTWGTCDYEAVRATTKPIVEHAMEQPISKRSRDAGVILLDYAAASLACGDFEQAQRTFYECILLTNDLTLGASQGEASLVFDEALKVWQGEAYERAMMELLHGLCLLNMRDYSNARVAFDRAISTDMLSHGAVAGLEGSVGKHGLQPNERYASAGGSVYQRDFLAAYVLRTLCYIYDGRIARAQESWEQTQRIAQELVDAARYQAGLFAIQTWTGPDGQYVYPNLYVAPYHSVPHDLQLIVDTDFEELQHVNALAVFASGSRPRKIRTGTSKMGGSVKYVHDTYWAPAAQIGNVGLLIDGAYAGPMSHCLNLYGQAAGRGPSAKDLAQQRKEAIENIGEALQQHGVFGLQYIGMGIRALNKEEADVRQWGLLPNAIHLWFGRVEPGEHLFACVPLGHNLPSTEPALLQMPAPFVQAVERAWAIAHRTALFNPPAQPCAARHIRYDVADVPARSLKLLFFAEAFNQHARRASLGDPQAYELLPRRKPEVKQ